MTKFQPRIQGNYHNVYWLKPGVLNLFRPTEPFGPKKSFAVQDYKNSFRGSVFYLKKNA